MYIAKVMKLIIAISTKLRFSKRRAAEDSPFCKVNANVDANVDASCFSVPDALSIYFAPKYPGQLKR